MMEYSSEWISQKLNQVNENCLCFPVGDKMILGQDASDSQKASVPSSSKSKSSFYANTGVFVLRSDFEKMIDVIKAIETVVQSKEYIQQVKERDPSISFNTQAGTRGLFMGYDFHITENGPKLIETNTNAGGAFLTKMLPDMANAFTCCFGLASGFREGDIEDAIIKMFHDEWRAGGLERKLSTVAIVDENIEQQFLYPEMLQAAAFLQSHGINAIVADISELTYVNGKLSYNSIPIDMVYNRSTDFLLNGGAASSVRQAYEDNSVIVSPSPRHHALFADKRNLKLFNKIQNGQDQAFPLEITEALRAIPETQTVQDLGEQAWKKRKQLFFKPSDGFGSKAVYRGDKITKRVWSDISQKNFIAQEFAPPSIRGVSVDGSRVAMKYDIRIYTYASKPLFPIARIYSGQTTNFRTPGGGFAPLAIVL